MAKSMLLDEWFVTFRIPKDVPDDAIEAIRRVLTGDDLITRLRRTVRATIRALPELTVVRVSLTR